MTKTTTTITRCDGPDCESRSDDVLGGDTLPDAAAPWLQLREGRDPGGLTFYPPPRTLFDFCRLSCLAAWASQLDASRKHAYGEPPEEG
jgi:hypothetical protein